MRERALLIYIYYFTKGCEQLCDGRTLTASAVLGYGKHTKHKRGATVYLEHIIEWVPSNHFPIAFVQLLVSAPADLDVMSELGLLGE
tara:strand:- start:280 stop:540 length:261 start_codon:yes stop_codon:yes gene_type:complete